MDIHTGASLHLQIHPDATDRSLCEVEVAVLAEGEQMH